MSTDLLGLFLLLTGFVIGLGSITVIDIHGFLARHSNYWTEATTRTHKVTKPLIWSGIILAIIGGLVFYSNHPINWIPVTQAIVALILITNGFFLSFQVSPYLLQREQKNKSSDLLSKKWQTKITVSFIVSFIGWWSALFILVWYIVNFYE